jgi:hypothetical protein
MGFGVGARRARKQKIALARNISSERIRADVTPQWARPSAESGPIQVVSKDIAPMSHRLVAGALHYLVRNRN